MMKPILRIAVAAMIGAASPAFATNVTMYDEISSQTFAQNYADALTTSNQGWGVLFNSGLATTLTGINALVTPFGNSASDVVVQILADGGSGTPAGAALYASTTQSTSVTGVDLTGLAIAINASTNYWLAVLPTGSFGSAWSIPDSLPGGTDATYTVNTVSWAPGGDTVAFAATITGSYVGQSQSTGVPEPASLALLGIGLLGTAATRRRRH